MMARILRKPGARAPMPLLHWRSDLRHRFRLLALASALAALLAMAAPAAAITYGQLDDGEHPYVGFLIFFDPARAACSFAT